MTESEIDYSLEDIGTFRITLRSFEDYRETFDIRIEELPPDARILDVGSSLNQEFARALNDLRPDVKVVSLDASLALPVSEEKLKNMKVSYSIQKEKGGPIIETSEEDRALRMKEALSGTVAAIAPVFPFADESFDRIYDNHAAFMYLTNDERHLLTAYVRESLRILKTDGELDIYPIDLFDETGNWNDEGRAGVQGRMEKIVQELSLPAENVHFFENIDKTATGDITRLGIKITK